MIRYNYVTIDNHRIFYREAGPVGAPAIILLHGFPSSSHMFRDLIPKLAGRFRVIAPDYLGFGFSDQPSANEYKYTFDNLTSIVEKLLFDHLKLGKFSIYVQDYGAPIGFRLSSGHPDAIEAIVVQNGNAYAEGIGSGFEPLKAFWANRNAQTEEPVRSLLTIEATKFQYTYGANEPSLVSPDAWTFDQYFLDRPGNDAIQLDLFYNYPSNVALYDEWHEYFRKRQPRTLILWGQNDPFFTVEGARAFQRDLPNAELHLLAGGHFALEEYSQSIGDEITRFLATPLRKTA